MKTRTVCVLAGLALALLACRGEGSGGATPTTSVLDAAATGESPIALWPDEDFRSQRPEAGESPALVVPEVEHFVLSNGLDVYFMPEPTLPVARAWLDFDIGGAADPKAKVGMHSLCGDLVDEGT